MRREKLTTLGWDASTFRLDARSRGAGVAAREDHKSAVPLQFHDREGDRLTALLMIPEARLQARTLWLVDADDWRPLARQAFPGGAEAAAAGACGSRPGDRRARYAERAGEMFEQQLEPLWDETAGVYRTEPGATPYTYTPFRIGAAPLALDAVKWFGPEALSARRSALRRLLRECADPLPSPEGEPAPDCGATVQRGRAGPQLRSPAPAAPTRGRWRVRPGTRRRRRGRVRERCLARYGATLPYSGRDVPVECSVVEDRWSGGLLHARRATPRRCKEVDNGESRYPRARDDPTPGGRHELLVLRGVDP